MRNAITAEFLKLRRSRALLLAGIANALPPAVKCLRHLSGNLGEEPDWQVFLASGQELTVFCLLITVLLLSAHLFTLEYQHDTAAVIFTSGTKRAMIYWAKMVTLAAVIAGLVILSAASQLIFGALAVGRALPGDVLRRFICVTIWYVFSYWMLSAVAALVAVLAKRFVLTAVITFGYYILIFPFHTRNAYVCPFMTPSVVAAKLYGATGYIFAFSYDNLTTGVLPAGAFLVCLAGAALALGVLVYRKSDAVR